jgi:hypothetical protein
MCVSDSVCVCVCVCVRLFDPCSMPVCVCVCVSVCMYIARVASFFRVYKYSSAHLKRDATLFSGDPKRCPRSFWRDLFDMWSTKVFHTGESHTVVNNNKKHHAYVRSILEPHFRNGVSTKTKKNGIIFP